MSTTDKTASQPDTTPADAHGLKIQADRDGAGATGQVPLDPSVPAPGAAEKHERISDAMSDADKPAGVESVDKGA